MKSMETSGNKIPETMKKLGFRSLTFFRKNLVMYIYYIVVILIT